MLLRLTEAARQRKGFTWGFNVVAAVDVELQERKYRPAGAALVSVFSEY